jgi:hypothetical protein
MATGLVQLPHFRDEEPNCGALEGFSSIWSHAGSRPESTAGRAVEAGGCLLTGGRISKQYGMSSGLQMVGLASPLIRLKPRLWDDATFRYHPSFLRNNPKCTALMPQAFPNPTKLTMEINHHTPRCKILCVTLDRPQIHSVLTLYLLVVGSLTNQ